MGSRNRYLVPHAHHIHGTPGVGQNHPVGMVAAIRTDTAKRTTGPVTKPITILEAKILDAMQQAIWTQQVANEAKKQVLKAIRQYQGRSF